MAEALFPVTLDPVAYDHKPQGREVGAITRRLQSQVSSGVTIPQLFEAVREGRTFTCGTFEPSERSWGAFGRVRLWALDQDNDCIVLNEDGTPAKDEKGHKVKRQLEPGEEGFLWPEDVRQRLMKLGFAPLFCYSTSKATRTAIRFRTVFDLGETYTDETEAQELILLILEQFGEVDQSCCKLNRLFFGSYDCGAYPYWQGGEVWPS